MSLSFVAPASRPAVSQPLVAPASRRLFAFACSASAPPTRFSRVGLRFGSPANFPTQLLREAIS